MIHTNCEKSSNTMHSFVNSSFFSRIHSQGFVLFLHNTHKWIKNGGHARVKNFFLETINFFCKNMSINCKRSRLISTLFYYFTLPGCHQLLVNEFITKLNRFFCCYFHSMKTKKNCVLSFFLSLGNFSVCTYSSPSGQIPVVSSYFVQ